MHVRRRTIIGPKGQIWVSAVTYILITVVVIFLLLNSGLPLLEKIRDRSIYSRTKDAFLNLNTQIKDVQAEGPGSQRVIPLEIAKGDLTVNDNQIKWTMESKAKIIEPRSKLFIGDLIIGDDSFITFEDTRTYLSDDFTSFSATNWNGTTSPCTSWTVTGSLLFTDAACLGDPQGLFSHQNFTSYEGLTISFTYAGGPSTTIPTDEFYIGWGNPTIAPTLTTAQIGGIVFNGTTGRIETTEYDGATLRHYDCYEYKNSTTYYGRIIMNDSIPQYFVSEDNQAWEQCYNQNSSKPALVQAFILAASGSASIDDIHVHDNMYHMNNSYLALKVNKHTGTPSSPKPINTSMLIQEMFSTLTNTTVNGNFTFRINDDPLSEAGVGYVQLSDLRSDPDAAVIISHVNASIYEYDLILTMEGGTDFVQVNVQNLVIQ